MRRMVGLGDNKDEAKKCLILAEQALSKGDTEKANRLVAKAQRMDPGIKIPQFFSEPSTYKSQPSDSYENIPKVTKSQSNSSIHRTDSSVSFTIEQQRLCETIIKEECYYKIFKVSKDAPEDVIRKAYKRLALSLHPDKNKAPKAEEAFKKISKASSILLDAEKRRLYDIGGEGVAEQPFSRHMSRNHRHHPDEYIFSADDVFRAVFGRNVRDFHFQRQREPQTSHHSFAQALPMIIMFVTIFVFNIISQTPSTPQFYSFHYSHEFNEVRTTTPHNVRYFVGDTYNRDIGPYAEKVREMDRTIELSYYQKLCKQETDLLSRELNNAHYYRASHEKIKQLLDRPRPGCKILETLKNISI